ncbi:unnamed protein product [Hermetia illucens]|uniref:Nuclear RNA export factor 2 n=1 Tax=Hermetia illucens TaxID=343691 RepID=A0A7R8YRT6_HERIL|nr:nuclear RNA export factor 2 [Hermetia illucens]CAD7081855.1 unnamed protein product [Hermetia illucens]
MSMHRNLPRNNQGTSHSDHGMDDLITMKAGYKPIRINRVGSQSYYQTSSYRNSLLNASYTWHLIDVHHRGMYSKADILDAFFNIIGDSEFYPVGYKEGRVTDMFIVRGCKEAIQKLFHRELSLRMPDHKLVNLNISLNAAQYSSGQIFPQKVLEKIVERQFKRLETTDQISNVLNLQQIGNFAEAADIIINLGSKPALELLCKVIAQNHNILNTINGLNLIKNNITDPSPLKEFVHSSIKMIDLRHNNIQHPHQFNELKCLNVDELYVSGNPCTTEMNYLDEIKKYLPTLKKLDGISTEKIKQTSTDTIEMMYPGDIILDDRDRVSFTMYRTSDMWCQVVVEHKGKCTKRNILKAIFEIVEGEFFPCYYKASRIEDTFFVRCCHDQLESLLDVGLALRLPDCDDIPMTLKMNVSDFKKGHVEPMKAIIAALSTRFNVMDKCLNLESLHTSPELKNVIVCLSHPHTLATVLTTASRRFLVNLEEIRLGKNRISSVKALKTLNSARSIKILDLNNNLIENLKDFENIIKIPITELNLDGNPLCKNFKTAGDYVRQVRKIFPELTKLDGYPITKQVSSAMRVERNFLCSLEAYGFVDHFINHYFPIFDSPLRSQLIEMYDRRCIVSLSFNYDASKLNSYTTGRTRKYELLNRNLLADPLVPTPNVMYKKDSVLDFFKYFPASEHDLFSFTTDVTIFTDKLVCLTVSGIFQEPATITDVEFRLAFTRTFLFKQHATELGIFKNTNEYKIINDIIFITNPTNDQLKMSFRYSKPNKTKLQEPTVEDKEYLFVMFQRMTGLKNIWCTRCFEDANWDFKKALEVFIKLNQENRIPDSAFSES